jgi:hypothetical protein
MVKIKVRRGLEEALPLFDEGEPGFTTDTKRAFFGSDEGNVELSKKEDVDTLTTTVTTNGKKIRGFINIAEYDVSGDGVNDDLTPIMNAVTDAITNRYAINWGWDGRTYLVTDTIPNFHTVKHIGNALIKRGTDLFYISPIGTQTNKLYASPTGSSNTFDGLTPDKPVAKIQQAFDWMANYSPILTGIWQVVLAAGTYPFRAVLQAGLRSENPIQVLGPDVGNHPNVPTAILSEGTGIAAVGIAVSNGSKIQVNNLKITGFNGSSSSAGLKASNGAEITTSNVHTDSCYWGVSGEGRSKITIPDGIHNNDGYLSAGGGTGAGIRSLQLTNHAIGIQNNGNQINTALFKNCYQAVFVQESSTGHVDWCTVQDCNTGIVARVNARVNCDGTVFKRNSKDIQVDSNGHVYVSSNVVFSTGTDESTNKVTTSSGGNITNSTMISGKELAYSIIEKTFDMQYPNQTVATTSNTVVYTATLKAPLWRGTPTTVTPMKKLYFRIFGTMNGANSNKRIYVRLGSALLGVTYAAADNGTFVADGYIYFTGPDTQFLFMKSSRHLGTSPKQSKINGTNVMTSDVNLTIEAQVDNAADNVVIEMIELGLGG